MHLRLRQSAGNRSGLGSTVEPATAQSCVMDSAASLVVYCRAEVSYAQDSPWAGAIESHCR